MTWPYIVRMPDGHRIVFSHINENITPYNATTAADVGQCWLIDEARSLRLLDEIKLLKFTKIVKNRSRKHLERLA